jgi:hypothetical protein
MDSEVRRTVMNAHWRQIQIFVRLQLYGGEVSPVSMQSDVNLHKPPTPESRPRA